MKKMLSVILILIMLCSLLACGKSQAKDTDKVFQTTKKISETEKSSQEKSSEETTRRSRRTQFTTTQPSTSQTTRRTPTSQTTSQATTSQTSPQTQAISTGKRNALSTAKDYLSYMPFSRQGLIDQLIFEGYTNDEATYGADNCGADWSEQIGRAHV